MSFVCTKWCRKREASTSTRVGCGEPGCVGADSPWCLCTRLTCPQKHLGLSWLPSGGPSGSSGERARISKVRVDSRAGREARRRCAGKKDSEGVLWRNRDLE